MKSKYKLTDYLSFLVPSLIGVALFMMPIKWDNSITIPIALLSKTMQHAWSEWLPCLTTILIFFSWLGSTVFQFFRRTKLHQSKFLVRLFSVSTVWYIVRTLGMLFAISALFQVGPEWLWSQKTSGLLLNDLLPVLFSVFFFAGMLLPLLLNFGLLELFGALMTKVMRPLFTLPGRSSIDCIASWLGDGTVGVLLTSKQHERGYYTKREAAVIGTTFSAVSITFSFVVLSQVQLAHLFVPFYFTVTFAGMIAAIIMPRIPPLSNKPDTFYEGATPKLEEAPAYASPLKWGLQKAINTAKKSQNVLGFFKEGFSNILDLWIGVTPVIMAIGTIALLLAEHTKIFHLLGMPFVLILNLLQVPEATEASKTLIIGFADMFLPTVLASSIESEFTRFVVACLSVTQLIYLSEVGGLLLGCKIPVTLRDLFIIFLERTLITLPIIVLIAHIIF